MNSKLFSLFLVTILGFSVVSASGNGWNTYQSAEFSINLSEDLTISSGFGQKIGNIHEVALNEQLVVSNHDKYQKLVTATKQMTERHAIMDRVAPNTRLRFAQDGDLLDNSNQVTMTEFIDIITDTFYDGGAKTPSAPSIPLAFAANVNSDSLQLLQVDERYGGEFESVYSDTGPPNIESNNHSSFSQIFPGHTPNFSQLDNTYYHITQLDEFSSNITLPELDFTETIIVVISPGVIYIILVAEGVVPGIRPPQIPRSAAFYFVFGFFVFTTFSTPFAIGNNIWGTAFGDMDNSTSTNSTQTDNLEDAPATNMTQIVQKALISQNSTVTETDNVADGSKHHTVSIAEGLEVGDGSPSNNQVQNEPVNDELSPNVEISESISFSESFEKQKMLLGMVQISEDVSFSDQLEIQADIIPNGTVRLNEWIFVNDEIDGVFGVGLITISESISFEDGIETELYRPLNEMIYISESIELSSQISIDGVVELQINEFLRISEEITIYTPIIRIEERLQMYDQASSQFIQITLNEIPVTNLIPQNSTLALNGTSYLQTNQDISEFTNQITVSAWIKPEFNDGTPQMVAISKDLTFQLLINNIAEPQHTPVFTIYDGMKWHQVVGTEQLEDGEWYHIAGVLDDSKITIFVDGIQQQSVSIPELVLVGEVEIITMDMGMSISENEIVIGADYDEQASVATSRFSGHISGVLIHNKALDVEFINEVIQNTVPYSTTEIILTETVQISDIQGLSGKGAVNINEYVSFTEMMDNGIIILPRILTEKIDLISMNGTYTNSTLALNGTGYVTIQDVISSEMNTMSISSWIKPEFNSGTPQYTITSKENSFNLYVTNIVQPPHTVGFSVFDGIQWNSISGHTALDDRWHHIIASVNGSNISLYMDGDLESKQTLQNDFSIGNNGQYVAEESQISVSDSEIIVGAYVSTLREEIKTSDKFVGKIATVDVFTEVLTAEQIAHKYETELLQFYKYVSLYETVQIDDELLDDVTIFYEFTVNDGTSEIGLHEAVTLNDAILVDVTNYAISIQEVDYAVNLDEMISFTDDLLPSSPFDVKLSEEIILYTEIEVINPLEPSINPEIQMIKSGFLITENPKFELEYYSENDAVKIDHKQIVNATTIANQLQVGLASTPSELLTTGESNEVATAIQVIETRNAILELEGQIEEIPAVIMPDDITQLQERIEEITESIDETVKKLEETRLEDKAEEIENSAEIIREAADIKQNLNQTGTWQTTHEIISTRIIAPDGSVFSEEVFFEKMREGKFDIEVLPDPSNTISDSNYKTPKPGIYTIENTITVDDNQYTINEEFAWGLVSLNTKKSTYYPGDTAEFVIVVLDSVGSPVCDANLMMSINGTTLSSGAGITPNVDCGIYDATYDTGAEGTYHVDISAIADGIQTGFETTFDVASDIEFDIIRTAQSKIDPVNNPNEFEVIVDITSHTDANEIQIVEMVPSVFGITTEGQTSTEDGISTITWNKTLVGNSTQISYTYSVPFTFPELYPLGEIQINHDGESYSEARPWFVANDPVTISDNTVSLDEVISTQDAISVVTSTNQVVLNEEIQFVDKATTGNESDGVLLSTLRITKDSDGARQGFGMGMTRLGDLDGDGVDDFAIGASSGDRNYANPDNLTWSASKYGAVYITYMNSDGSVKSTVTIDKDTANGPGSSAAHSYGRAIQNIGDIDGDGVNDIAVGADWQDNAKGEVYIHFMNANGSVKSTATIKDGVTNVPS